MKKKQLRQLEKRDILAAAWLKFNYFQSDLARWPRWEGALFWSLVSAASLKTLQVAAQVTGQPSSVLRCSTFNAGSGLLVGTLVGDTHSVLFVSETRGFNRQFFPQKFWVKSESTPLFLSKSLSLERKIATNLNSRQKYAFRTNIEFSRKCIYLQLKPI